MKLRPTLSLLFSGYFFPCENSSGCHLGTRVFKAAVGKGGRGVDVPGPVPEEG